MKPVTLELPILLPRPPEYWDYSSAPHLSHPLPATLYKVTAALIPFLVGSEDTKKYTEA
jgi:hypothetical protein